MSIVGITKDFQKTALEALSNWQNSFATAMGSTTDSNGGGKVRFPDATGAQNTMIGTARTPILRTTNSNTGSAYTRLKYSDPVGTGGGGRGPLVETSAPESTLEQIYNDLYPVKARANDAIRVTKMLATTNGIRWEGHMATVNTIQNQLNQRNAEQYGGNAVSFLKSLGKSLITGAMTTVATLGQTAAAGTGVHFTPLEGRAYTTPVKQNGEFIPKMDNGNLFIAADATSKGTQIARPSYGGNSISDFHNAVVSKGYKSEHVNPYSIDISNTLSNTNSLSSLSNTTSKLAGIADPETTDQKNYDTEQRDAKYEGGPLEKAVKDSAMLETQVHMRNNTGYGKYNDGQKTIAEGSALQYNKYGNGNGRAPYKFGNGTTGSMNVRGGNVLYGDKDESNHYYKTSITVSKADSLDEGPGDNLKLSGLIPFYISSIAPNKRINCVFEANLDSYSDDYTGTWEDIQYVGRADKFHAYSGFERKIQFAFKAVAKSADNLIPIYDNLNYLAGTTAPTYDSNGVFMRGTLACVRIGDILKDQIGIITTVNFKWDTNVPWELEKDKEGKMIVPHMLTATVSFTPIHNFVPTADSVFFGDSNKITR